MSNIPNSPQSASNVRLSEISSTVNQAPATPIQVIMSTNTPLFIPRITSNSNLAAMTDGFSLTGDEQSQLNNNNNIEGNKYANHSFSQLLSNTHLHNQVASEVDYSAYIGKQKHLFAHTPGTTHYHSKSLFSISYKQLLALLTFLFTLHWFNHGVFQTILSDKSASKFTSQQSTLILTSSLIAIIIFAPIIGYLARKHPPLRILWIGFSIILLATFITAFATNFVTMFCARFLMGIGDATIIPIAAPLVLYTAAPDKKSLCLSIYLSSIPLGYSFGYFVCSELINSLPNEFQIIDEAWQRLFCWETVFLIPIIVYAWWRIEGPDSLIHMTPHNKKTHNLYDIITNQLYLGIVFGHTLQGFGCCVLTIIVWNKLPVYGFNVNTNYGIIEVWSLSIFIFGTLGILCGGLATDYVHNNAIFYARKKRSKKKKNSKKKTDTCTSPGLNSNDKLSIAQSPSRNLEHNGDIANSHSLGNNSAVDNTNIVHNQSDNIAMKVPPNIHVPYISKSLDCSPLTRSQNVSANTANTANSNKFSLNSDNPSGYDPNRKESIEQYKLRKFVENQAKKLQQNSLSHMPPPEIPPDIAQKQSLAALKKEQMQRKERRRKRREKKRKRRKKRELKKRFKPTTNLHTIRICFCKVVIPTSLSCLFCIILLYFLHDNPWAFGIFALIAQILTFIQVSALYTSMLWSIGIEWQCFGCGLAEIGFHLAGDGIAPGLISNLLLGKAFKFDLLILIIVMLISILIFFISWKFVDFQIWNITKNNKNSKMFDLLYDETIYTSSSITPTTTTNSITTMNDAYEYNDNEKASDDDNDSSDTSNSSEGNYNNDHYGDDEQQDSDADSETNEYSTSDWNPGNYHNY